MKKYKKNATLLSSWLSSGGLTKHNWRVNQQSNDAKFSPIPQHIIVHILSATVACLGIWDQMICGHRWHLYEQHFIFGCETSWDKTKEVPNFIRGRHTRIQIIWNCEKCSYLMDVLTSLWILLVTMKSSSICAISPYGCAMLVSRFCCCLCSDKIFSL